MFFALPALLILTPCVHALQYSLVSNHSGSTFFDGWTFVEAAVDPSGYGNIHYLSKDGAMKGTPPLAYIDPTTGRAVIKVDDVNEGNANDNEFGRNSVRLNSTEKISSGNLVIADFTHLPFGCSVWPAFWMEGGNWPHDGEIDIIENVNLATSNQMALHTTNGCRHPDSINAAAETGTLVFPDCFVNSTNGNTGCLVRENKPNSFGSGFASAGGGVYAMLWDTTGIKIWFFGRASIPSDLPTSNPNPSSWSTPSAFYPSTSCDFNTFFQPQTMILNINICGDFAMGLNNQVFNQTCSGSFPGGCLSVVRGASNYKNAYFEINYVRVFSESGGTSSSSSTPSSTTLSGSSPSASRPSSAVGHSHPAAVIVFGVGVVMMASLFM